MTTEIEKIKERLDALEKAVFANQKGTPQKNSSKKTPSFSGAKGGVEFLITKEFFKQKRTAVETKEALVSEGYHYLIQVVQTTLNRLATTKGSLVALKEGGKKYYVLRK